MRYKSNNETLVGWADGSPLMYLIKMKCAVTKLVNAVFTPIINNRYTAFVMRIDSQTKLINLAEKAN